MPESYKPGQRQPKYGQNYRITENRYAWVQVEGGKFMILVGDDEGHGQDVVIYHPRPGRQPDISIKLCDLTSEELTALEGLFSDAFKWARPVVERRDKEAEDAWNAGDDSHSRNYRPSPTVVYRKRPVGEHGESVRERSEGVPPGGGGGGDDRVERVRGAGDELAQPDEDGNESVHDDATTD